MDELIKAVRDLQSGDAEAFQIIYEKTRRQTLAHIRRYCDDEDRCEDFLQETYMQLYKSINQLENPDALQGWLNTTAKRLIGRSAEKDNRLPTQNFSSIETEDGSEPDFEDERENSNPELISDRKAVAEIVNQILEMLPKEQREALMMVYGQKVTIKEMAAQLQISENTIKSRLLQGRRKLMEHKSDFRRLGVELPAVGIAALIAVTYEENLAAQAAVGAVSGAVLKNGTLRASLSEAQDAAASAASRMSEAAGNAAADTGMALPAENLTAATASDAAADATAGILAAGTAETAAAVSAETASSAASAIGATTASATGGAAASASGTAAATASASVSGTAAAATTAAAAATAAKAAGTGIAVKLIAGAAAVAVAGGIAAGVVTSKGHSDSAASAATEVTSELSIDAAAEDIATDDADAGMPLNVELSAEEKAALNELYTYADEANNTDRYLADYLFDNYELLSAIRNKLPDKEVIYTGDGFVQGTSGTGVYLKSASELYVGGMKDGLPEGYGCLARLKLRMDYGCDAYEYEHSEYYTYPTYLVPDVISAGYSGYWANGKANGKGFSYTSSSSIYFNINGLSLISDDTQAVIKTGRVHSDEIYFKIGTFIDDLADGEYIARYSGTKPIKERVIPVNKGQVDETRLGGSSFEIKDEYWNVKHYGFHWEDGGRTGYNVFPELGGLGNNCRWDALDTWNQSDSFIENTVPIEFKHSVLFTDMNIYQIFQALTWYGGFDNKTAWRYLEKLSEAMNSSMNNESERYGAELMPVTDGNTISLRLYDWENQGAAIVYTYSVSDDSCTVTIE